MQTNQGSNVRRREFLKAASGVAMAAAVPRVWAAGSDRLRIATVGAGDRGTYDTICCLKCAPGIELVAMADLFRDRVDEALAKLRKEVPEQVKVTESDIVLGFDAYRKVMERTDVDLVLLLTPPGFRPEMAAAAVECGKHIFMEKPGAVDPVGVRSLLDTAAKADAKGLSIVVGTQQRYAPQYCELIQRIRDGQIGRVTFIEALWIGDMELWHYHDRKPEWSDMEWQIRCWPFFTWLSGDHFVEQLVHNLDVANWVANGTPVVCQGIGGRQVRTGPQFGNIYDHFAVRYEYADGTPMYAMATQIRNVTTRVCNIIHGTEGRAEVNRGMARIEGARPWKYEGPPSSGDTEMFRALVESIRERKPINECQRLAEATLTAVMGRMSAYTGRALKWEWVLNVSKLDLRPPKYEFGPLPVEPVALPGRTPLI
jgi:predicted dehydrogenase